MNERLPATNLALRRSVAWAPLAAVALATFLVHLICAARAGFHRDELYYLTGGWRFDPGYVDHPLLAPWVAGVLHELFGASPLGLRLAPTLGGALSVLLAGCLAATWGGDRRAQVLAGLATALCPFFFFSHTIFQTNLFDQLAWTAAILVLAIGLRAAPTGKLRPATWILFGVACAFGLATKYTIFVFGLALVLALAVTRRRELTNPWLFIGGAIAGLGLLPSLLWQLQRGLPFREFSEAAERWPPWTWIPVAALLLGLGALPLAWSGLRMLLRSHQDRLIGWTILMSLGIFLLTTTKPYYPNALFVPIFAAGATALQRTRSRWPEALLLVNLAVAPFMLPILPTDVYVKLPDPIGELAETVGWPAFVDQVEQAIDALPPEDRDGLVLVAANYGQAAALEIYGRGRDLPPILSGHNSYYFWSRDIAEGLDLQGVIALGYSEQGVAQAFDQVRTLGRIQMPEGIDNEEAGRPIVLGRSPRQTASELLEAIRHFD